MKSKEISPEKFHRWLPYRYTIIILGINYYFLLFYENNICRHHVGVRSSLHRDDDNGYGSNDF